MQEYALYRIIDALCWHYEDRAPRLANGIYDWWERRGYAHGWDAAFARSKDKLEVAADRVRANHVAGLRIPLEDI